MNSFFGKIFSLHFSSTVVSTGNIDFISPAILLEFFMLVNSNWTQINGSSSSPCSWHKKNLYCDKKTKIERSVGNLPNAHSPHIFLATMSPVEPVISDFLKSRIPCDLQTEVPYQLRSCRCKQLGWSQPWEKSTLNELLESKINCFILTEIHVKQSKDVFDSYCPILSSGIKQKRRAERLTKRIFRTGHLQLTTSRCFLV